MSSVSRLVVLDDYGPELFANSTFDANVTSWQARPTGLSTIAWHASGSCEVTITGAGGGLAENQTLALTIGKTYRVAFIARAGTYAGQMALRIAGGSPILTTGNLAAGNELYWTTFVAATADLTVDIARVTAATGTMYVDSFSLRRA
jgi:hypothetical protein